MYVMHKINNNHVCARRQRTSQFNGIIIWGLETITIITLINHTQITLINREDSWVD